MTRRAVSSAIVAALAATLAAGCATTPRERPEPIVRVVTNTVTKPVPCPALAELAASKPVYPDTEEAIRAAANMAERALLYAKGRLMRMAREAQYEAAASACDF